MCVRTCQSTKRHGTDVVAIIGVSIEYAATRKPIGWLFEMQISRLCSYILSCFAINVPRSYGLAVSPERAANLPVNGDDCK